MPDFPTKNLQHSVLLWSKNKPFMLSACYYLGDENSSWFACMAIMFKAAARGFLNFVVAELPEFYKYSEN